VHSNISASIMSVFARRAFIASPISDCPSTLSTRSGVGLGAGGKGEKADLCISKGSRGEAFPARPGDTCRRCRSS
jgi:hypothetical protein